MSHVEKGRDVSGLVTPPQQLIVRDSTSSTLPAGSSIGSNGIPLYHYQDLPPFLQGNPYITFGYRAYLPTDMCIQSIFVMTNETVNIWTHLIGFVIFSVLLMDDILLYLPENNAIWSDYAVFIVMDICFQVCMMCSAGYHIFYCQSELACKRWLGLDLAGVSVGFCGILFPGAYYAFYCNQRLQIFYLLLLMGCLIISGTMQLHHAFLSAQWHMRRMLLYGVSIFLGLAPVLHWVALQGGFYTAVVMLFMPYIATIFILIVIGGIFYVTKFPERQFPGRVNFIGSSHQWWHVFILLSFIATHHFGTFGFHYLQRYGCVDHVISEHVRVAR